MDGEGAAVAERPVEYVGKASVVVAHYHALGKVPGIAAVVAGEQGDLNEPA